MNIPPPPAESPLGRARTSFQRAPIGAALLLLLTAPLFAATSVRGGEVNVDVEPVAATAWNFARTGTIDLSESLGSSAAFDEIVAASPFVDEHEGRTIGNRPPGLWLLSVPAYLVWGDETFSVAPSTAVAVLVALAAVQVVHLVLRACVGGLWAFTGAVVFAVGTATWPIASAQLWPHGPGQLLVALMFLAHARGRPGLSGLCGGGALLVRPVTAVIAGGTLVRTLLARQPAAPWLMALPIGVATAGLIAYNGWAFGSVGISGGYTPDLLLGPRTPSEYPPNLVRFFVGSNGMLVWSPVLIIGLLGARRAWVTAPRWARDGAIAGLAYIVVHAALNRASGGYPFASRYSLEAITAGWPLLVTGARAWIGQSPGRLRFALALAAISIFLQASVAFTARCVDIGEATFVRCTLW